MLCAKRKHDRDVIIKKCLGFYDLQSNKKYIFFEKFSLKL